MQNKPKIFVLGLPRTGTTSFCITMLELGYPTAHVALTKASVNHATVIADSPIFADYPHYDRLFPGSKFIYLDRKIEDWLPSIKQLLIRLFKNMTCEHGGFHPLLKSSYHQIFTPLTRENIHNDQFLTNAYLQHKEQVLNYFSNRVEDLLTINLASPNDYQRLLDFLIREQLIDQLETSPFAEKHFPKTNMGNKITYWKSVKHPLKVPSNFSGEEKNKYFDFSAVNPKQIPSE